MTAPDNCDRCPALVAVRSCIVNGRSVGDKPRYAMVGQNPGRVEDETGQPFVHESGQVLAALLPAVGISLQDVYLDNACKCLSPGNRKPKVPEIAACREYLLDDLRRIDPDVIVALGVPAVTSLYPKGTSLDSVLGQVYVHPELGKPVVASYHPAFLIRGQWAVTPLVLSHLETARRVVEGTQPTEGFGTYATITTLDQLKALRDYLLTCETIFLDCETTGLNWMIDEILCLSFAGHPGEGYTVPILRNAHPGIEPWWHSEEEEIKAADLIEEILASDVSKSLQNASFDIRFFERDGSEPHVTAKTAFGFRVINLQHDTLLMSRTIAENLPTKEGQQPHELPKLLARHTGLPPYEEEVRKQSANKQKMAEVDDADLWKYAAIDADAVARLTPILRQKLAEDGQSEWPYDNITIPMIRCCQEMSRRGVLVDVPYFKKLCEYHDNKADEMAQQVYTAAGKDFNINSPQQVQKVLFQDLGLAPSGKKTDAALDCAACQAGRCSKHDSTDEDSLLAMKAQKDHPALAAIIEWRQLHKLRGTYLAGSGGKGGGFAAHIRPDNRIHFSFNVGGAATFRLSSQDPNGQNIPKGVKIPELGTKNAFRRTFIAPDGSVVMEGDWSQAETWALAYKLAKDFGDRSLLDVLESGRDVHTFVSRHIWPFDPDLDDYEWQREHEDLRRDGKVFTFGIPYGLTVQGIMDRLHCEEHDAASLLGLYFSLVPGLPDYIEFVHGIVRAGGTLENVWGMRRRFPEVPIMRAIQSRRTTIALEGLYRIGVNFFPQSEVGGLHNITHIQSENSEKLSARAKIGNAVHDSCLFETPAPDLDYCLETAWMIKNLWQSIALNTVLPSGEKLGWQIPVEISWGPNWGDLHHVLTARGDYIDTREREEAQ